MTRGSATALPFPLPARSLAGGGQLAMLSWERVFPGTPDQAGAARRFTASLLIGSPLRDEAMVVISELFTNAVLHTASGKPGGRVTVQVNRWRHGVRIATADQGSPEAPVIYGPAAAAASPAESGNGLFMVSCLASHLHSHGGAAGRTLCAILSQAPGPAPEPDPREPLPEAAAVTTVTCLLCGLTGAGEPIRPSLAML